MLRFKVFQERIFRDPLDNMWQERISITLESPEISKFKPNKLAGKLSKGNLVMHNGIVVHPTSYYNKNYYHLLQATNGIHEPQEEYIFSIILKFLPEGSVMLELGSYWAFYSIWFNKEIGNAKNYMIEPEYTQLYYGKYNFNLNDVKGSFYQYYISSVDDLTQDIPKISIDTFLNENNISHLNVLHSDIQGFEVDMLEGANDTLKNKKVDVIFISTHSNEIHANCIQQLKKYEYMIIASVNLDESYSVDGLIVALSDKGLLPEKTLEDITSLSKRNG